jgi:hypothetical protein
LEIENLERNKYIDLRAIILCNNRYWLQKILTR